MLLLCAQLSKLEPHEAGTESVFFTMLLPVERAQEKPIQRKYYEPVEVLPEV